MYIWIPNSIAWTGNSSQTAIRTVHIPFISPWSVILWFLATQGGLNLSPVCVCVCVCVCMCVSCSVMSNSCDLMNCSPPGFFVHGISQARILEWVSIPFSRGSSQPRDWTQVSRIAGRFFIIWATRQEVCHLCQNPIRKSLILFPPKNGRKEKTVQGFLT